MPDNNVTLQNLKDTLAVAVGCAYSLGGDYYQLYLLLSSLSNAVELEDIKSVQSFYLDSRKALENMKLANKFFVQQQLNQLES